jgi:hypothetical protein
MDNEMKKHLGQLNAQILRKFDQELQEVRFFYDKLSNEERNQFRNWLAQLAEICENPVKWLPMRVEIHTDNTFHNEDGEVVYHGSASLSPKVMFKAVEAWNNGEEYTPKGAFGTF